MRQLIIPAAILMLFFACGGKQTRTGKAITEQDLLGDWETVSGGDAEYITFAKEEGKNTFSSFLRARPLYMGEWKLEQGKLIIISENGPTNIYTQIRLKDGTLDLDNGKEIYKRMNTSISTEPAKELLEKMAEETGLEFTKPESAQFAWTEKNEGASEPGVQAFGYKVSYKVIIKTDFTELNLTARRVNEFLEKQGFQQDASRTTEIRTGFQKEKVVVFVLLRSNPEAVEGEAAYIEVQAGMIE